MKLLGFLLLLFTSVLASVEKANNETVIVLTTKNFGDTLKDSQFVVVYFHENTTKSSEWLSKTTPDDDFVSVAEEAKETLPGLKFAKLNTDEQKGYTTMFNITELPAIKMFSKGKSTPVSYNGDFTVTDILDWLKQRVDKNIPKLKTLDQLVFQIKNHTHLSLYLGSPLSEGYAEFLRASTLFISSNVGFAVSDEESIKKEVGADDDTLIVYRNHSEEVNHVDGPFTMNKIKTFVDGHIYPSLMSFNAISKKRIFDEDRDAIFFIGNQPHFSGNAIEGFESISQQFRDKIIFSAALFTDPYGTALAEYLGVYAGELPAIVILHSNDKMTKYRLDQEVNFRNIGIFLLNFYHNNLVPYYKSSPYPIEEYDGDVKIVISKTFKEIVFDENYDVLIEFYSPKCKKCQAFAPHYSSIATRLTNLPNLIVAKIDGSMNDVEGVELSGFPSIRYYPRGRKQSPVIYSGEFTEQDVIDFVHKQVSDEV